MAIVDRVREVVAPLAEAASVDLYDVEHHGAVVRVLIDADGGIGIDAIARFSRSVSRALDEHDPIEGRYTLEVSSPGLERPLRSRGHFRAAVGAEVKVKTRPGAEGARRLVGVLESADDDGVEIRGPEGLLTRVGYDEVASARTVFDWDAARRGRNGQKAGQQAQEAETG